jgi:sporulation protein YlmC with PRC-barrel domain
MPIEFVTAQKPGQLRASELIGTPVFDRDGKPIAEISDLVVDGNYQVAAVVVSAGGTLFGLGDRKVALPRYAISIAGTSGVTRASVTLSEDDLANAPPFVPLYGSAGLLSDGGWLDRTVGDLAQPGVSPPDAN